VGDPDKALAILENIVHIIRWQAFVPVDADTVRLLSRETEYREQEQQKI
jgi:hypothetical protein